MTGCPLCGTYATYESLPGQRELSMLEKQDLRFGVGFKDDHVVLVRKQYRRQLHSSFCSNETSHL